MVKVSYDPALCDVRVTCRSPHGDVVVVDANLAAAHEVFVLENRRRLDPSRLALLRDFVTFLSSCDQP